MAFQEELMSKLYRYIALTKKDPKAEAIIPPQLQKLLTENKDKLHGVRDYLESNILLVATKYRLNKLAELILALTEKKGWDLEEVERSNQTVMHLATNTGNVALAKILMGLPGVENTFVMQDVAGFTPIHYMAFLGPPIETTFTSLYMDYLEAASQIRSRSGQIPSEVVPLMFKRPFGFSEIHIFILRNIQRLHTAQSQADKDAVVTEFKEKLNQWIEQGVDLNDKSFINTTALEMAVYQTPDLVQTILERPELLIHPEGETIDPIVSAAFAYPYLIKMVEGEMVPDFTVFWQLYDAQTRKGEDVDWSERLASISRYPHVEALLAEILLRNRKDKAQPVTPFFTTARAAVTTAFALSDDEDADVLTERGRHTSALCSQ